MTVGTELPFDRMVRVVDEWAGAVGRKDIFAQIGRTHWTPRNIASKHYLAPTEFAARFKEASLIIAHAGMGTILTALYAEKPILVVPRRANLGEHRNEHQLATARCMRELGKVEVALDESELRTRLEDVEAIRAGQKISRFADRELTLAIRQFIRSSVHTSI